MAEAPAGTARTTTSSGTARRLIPSVSPLAAHAFTLRWVDYEVTPEPSEQERAAIDAALLELDREEPPAYRSAWRRAALDPDDED